MPPVLRVEFGMNGARRALVSLQPMLFTLEQRVNAIPQATVLLSVSGNSVHTFGQVDEVAWCRPGAEVSVYFDGQQGRQDGPAFTGIVVEQALELHWDSAVLTLRMKHALARLESGCRSAVYAELSAAEIVNRLLRGQGVDCNNTAGMTAPQEQAIQFQCSDWRYVRALLDANDAWLLPRAQGVEILRPRLAAKPHHTIDRLTAGAHGAAFDASWTFNAQYQPAGVRFEAWNIERQEVVSVSAAPPALGTKALDAARVKALNPQTWAIGHSAALMPQALELLANSLQSRLGQAAVQGEFKLAGSRAYQLGQTLATTGFGECFDGSGIITAIRHHIDKSRWTTTVSLGLSGLQAELSPLPSIAGLHTGIVAEFEADPKDSERLRVALPILGNQAIWARLALPHASKGSGFHFYPEEGDEVVVGFFDADPASPVVVGAMHNPVNRSPVPLSKENRRKGFTLRQEDKELALALEFDGDVAAVTLKAHEDSVTLNDGVVVVSKSEVTLQTDKDSVSLKEGVAVDSESRIALKASEDCLSMKDGVVIDSKSGAAEVQIRGKQIKLINT